MQRLIIAEKPSVARAIASALGGFRHRRTHYESDHQCLTWAQGHLAVLKEPEDYEPRYRRWDLGDLPIIPLFALKPAPSAGERLEVIARLALGATGLVNACDAGREGELIFRYLVALLGLDHLPVERVWLTALTGPAIRQAFAAAVPASHYDRLYQAAACRSEGDWLVGINASRAFSCRFGSLLALGRVQTPTLALVVRRERAMADFVSRKFYGVQAEFVTVAGRRYAGRWLGPDGSERCFEQELAERVSREVAGKTGLVTAYHARETSEPAPLLLDMTACQRLANQRLGLGAAATARALQELYEARLISYPRTDSRYLPSALCAEVRSVLPKLGTQPAYGALVQAADPQRVHAANRRVFADARVGDHHALLPTGETPGRLSVPAARVYDLVVRAFLGQFYPPARYLQQEATTTVGAHEFKSIGRRVLERGWRVLGPAPAPDHPLPVLQDREAVTVAGVEVTSGQTEPPPRYTEGALLRAMETAGRAVEDEELAQAMKDRGLGTAATRAAIIERLKEVGYLTTQKQALRPTVKGMQAIALVEQAGVGVLCEPELTAVWEQQIARIASGEEEAGRFRRELRELAGEVVRAVAAYTAESAVVPVGYCPNCRAPVARSGRGWSCQADGCGFSLPGKLLGVSLGEGDVAALLSAGRTRLLRGFVSRRGRRFSARLRLAAGGLEFEFPKRRPRRR